MTGALFDHGHQSAAPHFVTRQEGGKMSISRSSSRGSNDPWRTVSIGSDEVVVTLAFRDTILSATARQTLDDLGDLRLAMKNALAANSWDYCNEILAAALSGEHKSHELSGDCWCQPRVETVAP